MVKSLSAKNIYVTIVLFPKIIYYIYTVNENKRWEVWYLRNNFLTFLIFFQMNIYVANIPFKANDEQLRTLFAEYGEVSSAKIITDKFTNKAVVSDL